ncbi:hypothetical protein [Patulibacter defluvii]|uniref:hypothetical protein n=1 Tax=Patulibacter defluvii TaxID=3095358 RepID=UPI002A753581|nr:hypothetical protein [Patulibacter sp. DM4]
MSPLAEPLEIAPPRVPRRRTRLTADEILDAIRRWHDQYGEPPGMADWDPYRARQIGQQWRIERYDAGDWPSAKSVRNHFGRLSNAVAAAGLVPRHQGQQRPQPELELSDEIKLHLSHLRAARAGATGFDDVAAAVRDVVAARHSSDADDLRAALVDLAATALGCADRLGVPHPNERTRP